LGNAHYTQKLNHGNPGRAIWHEALLRRSSTRPLMLFAPPRPA